MVAAAGFEELHSTEAVMSSVLLSLKVPVAANCLVVPTAMLELAGVTARETKVAPVTVREALPVTEPEAAVMVAAPVPVAVAIPEEFTEATFVAEDDQVSEVSSCVLPSSNVPTAVNGWVVPSAIEPVAGVTAIEIRWAGTTVRELVSLNEPTVAVIVVCPAPTVVAKPELLMVATEVEDELQVTPLTRSCDEPSL